MAVGDPSLSAERRVDMYRKTLRIRQVEEAIAGHCGEGEMRCYVL